MTSRRLFSRAFGCALPALTVPDRLWAAQAAPAPAATFTIAGVQSYPAANAGLYDVTRDAKDVGKFKAPTLRNIAVTAPYMHDGSVATLEEAIDRYAAGGRTIPDGPYRGAGRDNANKSPTIRGFTLTVGQRADLVAFLRSLTDEELLRDQRFANPWAGAGSRLERDAGRASP